MKTKIYFIILVILALLITGCTQKAEQVYDQEPKVTETLIISLEKINEVSEVTEKYEVYNTGKVVTSLINKNKEESKKEKTIQQSDVDYLKSLVTDKEFKSVPNYMEGAGENCPVLLLRITTETVERVVRSESCANAPESFNKVIESIEKLK